jgi:hemerythrin-like metal-binding protein
MSGFTLPWMRELTIESERLNGEHDALLQSLNDLLIAISSGDRNSITMTCDSLSAVAQAHFASEEAKMREAKYPELASHTAQHEELHRGLARLRYAVTSGQGFVSSTDGLTFLEKWFIRHLTFADKPLASFLATCTWLRTAPLPDNEAERLQALRDFGILDTPPETAFDDVTALAAYLCKRPMALVSLVDADRQWFKSKRGLEVSETPRDVAFCAHAILNPAQVMVVPDAQRDDRFADNPLVTSAPHIRFYAGAPLVTADGLALGTLCVLDREPGEITPAEIDQLQTLARHTVAQLEQRRGDVALLRAELESARHQIKTLEAKLQRCEAVQKAP